MKIAFIQALYYEYLGVAYLSACLKKKGHEVEVFIPVSDSDHLVSEIVNYKPDIIGFSIMTGLHDWAIAVSQKVKGKMDVYSIFGGPHATFFPELIENDGVDCVCLGESENSLIEITDILSKGETPKHVLGAWFKINGNIYKNELAMLVENLEKLPYPDRFLYQSRYPSLAKAQAVFLAGRGCPFECTFCFNHSLMKLYKGKGKYVRLRPVADLINEIKDVMKNHRVKTIYFQDDTFVLQKKWIKEFCGTYKKEIGLPFICLIRADLIDEETIQCLKEANCKTVFWGIESGVERTRNILLKKKLTDEQIYKCAQLLKKYKIKFRTYNILGFPGETLEEAFQTVNMNVKIKTDYPWCSIFQPFPKTELAEYAKKMGVLDEGTMLTSSSFFNDSPLKIRNKNEMINLQKLFFYAVKFPFLHPLIRAAIKLKPNPVYKLLFLAGYAWCYCFSELVSLKELLIIGKMNTKRLFKNI